MTDPKPSILTQPVSALGAMALALLASFGQFWVFVGQTLSAILGTRWWRWRYRRLLTPQFYEVGTRSVPVILVTGAFVGMVLAVQAYEQFAAAGLTDRLGVIVNISVLRELGPVLAGVMLAGRVGGALTAELGTMRVTEQIDAVRAMGASPIRFLVCPRFLGCLLLIPFLTAYCDIMGVLGGYFISVIVYGVNSDFYWEYSTKLVGRWDIAIGLIKSVFFGGAISLISCYKGFHCRPGAAGVGRATTEAFVASFMAILILDFFLALLLQTIGLRIWGFSSIF
ncbi:MAG: ABC transporter permease [Phycisphaerae bacterium]|nr:ABC transporter permease [Phycisphaerae bacterium]